ncbi:MAG: hypothetical protein R2761_25745 [Acidimicrobiales bacterium]
MTSGPGGERLLVVVDPAVVGSRGRAPLVVVTQTVRGGPGGRTLTFQAAVILPFELPLVVAEHDIAGPERGWELRAPGLWAETVCEEPGRRWTYGLEAFALALDDPVELLGRGFGHRVPLGWELEFEAPDDPQADSAGSGPAVVGHTGTGRGVLLFADRELEIEGPALRRAWTVTAPSASDTSASDTSASDTSAVDPERARPGPDGLDGTGAEGVTAGADRDDPLMAVALPSPAGVWWVGRTATGVRTWHEAT